RNQLSNAYRPMSSVRILLPLLLLLFIEGIGSIPEFDQNRIDPSIPKNVSHLQHDLPGRNDIELNTLPLGGQHKQSPMNYCLLHTTCSFCYRRKIGCFWDGKQCEE